MSWSSVKMIKIVKDYRFAWTNFCVLRIFLLFPFRDILVVSLFFADSLIRLSSWILLFYSRALFYKDFCNDKSSIVFIFICSECQEITRIRDIILSVARTVSALETLTLISKEHSFAFSSRHWACCFSERRVVGISGTCRFTYISIFVKSNIRHPWSWSDC